MFHGIFNKTANNLNTNNFNISTDYRVIQSISLYNIVYRYRWIYEYDYGSNFLLHLYMYVGIWPMKYHAKFHISVSIYRLKLESYFMIWYECEEFHSTDSD